MTTEGTTRITVKFVLERDIEDAAQDVREKVSGALRDLPPNILPPVIQKSDPDSDPVIAVVVASPRSLRETSEIADKQVKRVLETVDGVGEVSLTGARERQIRVFLDADKLQAHGLTITQVQRAIQSENVEIPGGRIIREANELGVRTLGRIDAVGAVRRHHRGQRRGHPDPRPRPRPRRGQLRGAAHLERCSRASRRCRSTCGARRAPTRSRSSPPSRSAWRRSRARCPRT